MCWDGEFECSEKKVMAMIWKRNRYTDTHTDMYTRTHTRTHTYTRTCTYPNMATKMPDRFLESAVFYKEKRRKRKKKYTN